MRMGLGWQNPAGLYLLPSLPTSAGRGRTVRGEVPLLYVSRVFWACSKPIGLLLFFTWASTSFGWSCSVQSIPVFELTHTESIAATQVFFPVKDFGQPDPI